MKAVDRGVEYLDAKLPGWRNEIDPDRLNVQWCSTCILGQLFGSYERGLAVLGLSGADATRLGFYRPPHTTWERLTAAWWSVIRR